MWLWMGSSIQERCSTRLTRRARSIPQSQLGFWSRKDTSNVLLVHSIIGKNSTRHIPESLDIQPLSRSAYSKSHKECLVQELDLFASELEKPILLLHNLTRVLFLRTVSWRWTILRKLLSAAPINPIPMSI